MPKPYTIHHVPGQHLTFSDREQMAIVYNHNLQLPASQRLSRRKMADQVGLPHTTFCREIKRGLVRQPSVHHDQEY